MESIVQTKEWLDLLLPMSRKITALKLLVTLFFTCYVCFDTIAQDKLSNREISSRISKIILENYQPDTAILSKVCRRGCTFIHFRINSKGKISNVLFSGDTVTYINAQLKKATLNLQKDSGLMKTLKGSDKNIIQPFIYLYMEGCKVPKNNSHQNESLDGADLDQQKTTDSEALLNADYLNYSLLRLLNFQTQKMTLLDCILLSPIQVGLGRME